MEWIQTISIIGTILATTYYIHRDIVTDMKSQNARTDRIYEMFCDIRKEFYREQKKIDQKFYDILKEQKK